MKLKVCTFSDYLLSGNKTKNGISTVYLVNSVKDETKSFKEFKVFLKSY